MNILDGIRNFLELINNNWTSIAVIIGLILAITKKAMIYFSRSNEEKIAAAKKQVQKIMLKLISDAEDDYDMWKQAGSLKRSQVIEEIFLTYPILSKVTDQDDLIAWIDHTIDESLVTLREIIMNNKQLKDGSL